jgi:hypothetical protein
METATWMPGSNKSRDHCLEICPNFWRESNVSTSFGKLFVIHEVRPLWSRAGTVQGQGWVFHEWSWAGPSAPGLARGVKPQVNSS